MKDREKTWQLVIQRLLMVHWVGYVHARHSCGLVSTWSPTAPKVSDPYMDFTSYALNFVIRGCLIHTFNMFNKMFLARHLFPQLKSTHPVCITCIKAFFRIIRSHFSCDRIQFKVQRGIEAILSPTSKCPSPQNALYSMFMWLYFGWFSAFFPLFFRCLKPTRLKLMCVSIGP